MSLCPILRKDRTYANRAKATLLTLRDILHRLRDLGREQSTAKVDGQPSIAEDDALDPSATSSSALMSALRQLLRYENGLAASPCKSICEDKYRTNDRLDGVIYYP